MIFSRGQCPGGDDASFVVEPFEPAYLALDRSGEIANRVASALRELEDCHSCPRHCHINRIAGETHVCDTGRYARVSSAFPHHGEEDRLRGWNGSGTIFFGGCNLRCVFCQNWNISQAPTGNEHTADGIAQIMLLLQTRGCHNINFVTPEHVVPQVVEAIAAAVPLGLRVPIVYNTSAYDSLSSLELLDGLVDIYMPDFKLWTRDSSRRYLKAKDYPERAREAIAEMHRQVGPLRFGPDGLARRGVLVRHLVMPGLLEESGEIFRWLSREISPDTYVNIMGQYRPSYEVGTRVQNDRVKYAAIHRRPRVEETHKAYELARRAGLRRFDERAPDH